MSQHTKEPWKVRTAWQEGEYAKHFIEPHVAEVFYETDEGHANARRIVTCVNACAGIPTERLEKVVRGDYEAYVNTMLHWLDQRNEIMDAAKALRAAQREYMADRGNEEKGKAAAKAASTLDDVIAKVELDAK